MNGRIVAADATLDTRGTACEENYAHDHCGRPAPGQGRSTEISFLTGLPDDLDFEPATRC